MFPLSGVHLAQVVPCMCIHSYVIAKRHFPFTDKFCKFKSCSIFTTKFNKVTKVFYHIPACSFCISICRASQPSDWAFTMSVTHHLPSTLTNVPKHLNNIDDFNETSCQTSQNSSTRLLIRDRLVPLMVTWQISTQTS